MFCNGGKKMSWENILKRPFDVGAARQSELQNREQKKQKALDLFPTMFGKYFDPDFKSQIEKRPNAKQYRVSMSDQILEYIKTLGRNHGVKTEEMIEMIKNAYPGVQQVKFDGQFLVFEMEFAK